MNRERYSTNNDPGTIESAEAYQITHNTKVVFQNLLYSLFDGKKTDFTLRDNTLTKFTIRDQFVAKPNDKPPIFIIREFPFLNRNYPFIVVSIPTKKERKMYLGWDNIASIQALKHNGITVSSTTEHQNWDMEVNMNIACKDVDDRDFLVDAVTYGFQGYFRSNYIWDHPDTLSTFIISAGSEAITNELSQTVTADVAGGELYPIYAGAVVVKIFVEHYYKVLKNVSPVSFEMQGSLIPLDPSVTPEVTTQNLFF
jgi:hypothetical protein